MFTVRFLALMSVVSMVFSFVFGLPKQQRFISEHSQDSSIVRLAWQPNGILVAAGTTNGQVSLFNIVSGTTSTNNMYTSGVDAITWSPNGQQFATVDESGDVVIWNDRLQVIRTFSLASPDEVAPGLTEMLWSPDGQILASIGNNGLATWDTSTGTRLNWYFDERFNLSSIAWNTDGSIIAVGSATGEITFRDAQTFEVIDVLPPAERTSLITGLFWHEIGGQIAASTILGEVLIWDVPTKQIVARLASDSSPILALDWDDSSGWLASSSPNGITRIWDVDQQIVVVAYALGGSAHDVAWSPYGGQLAIAELFPTATAIYGEVSFDDLRVIVPDPSLERLQSIAAQCDAPLTVTDAIPQVEQPAALTDFVAQVTALPEGTIPPACAADLIAVAEAISAGQ